jgi:hypothetical protein
MESYLVKESSQFGFNLYKFTGDGWILLFDYKCSGTEMFDFIKKLSQFFHRRMTKLADDLLEAPPDVLGLTFGIDRGTLIRLGMAKNTETEYIGRAINIACRLQGSIKDRDPRPQYKVLMTKNVNQKIKNHITNYRQKRTDRKLHNINRGIPFSCVKVWLNTSGEELKQLLLKNKFRLFFDPRVSGMSKTKIIRFGKEGQVSEGQNRNENSWRMDRHFLEFLNSKGQVYSRFYYSTIDRKFYHTNDPDTRSVKGQYMIHEE